MPVDDAGYFDHVPHGTGHDFRRAAITMLENMGISVEFSHHEGAPGQNEIDLRYADALSTADNIMTFRTVIKEVALTQGIYATFMPKPFSEHPGSGMHTHLSLFEGDSNAFYEAGAPYQLSKVGRQFIAGLLTPRRRDHRRHQPVGQLLQAPLGWGRGAGPPDLGPQQPLRPGAGADVQAEQGPVDPDRGALARLGVQPLPRLRRAARRRAQGHRGGLRAAPRDRGRRVEPHRRRAPGHGHQAAAEVAARAIEVMEKSELVADILGEHVFDFFLRNKRAGVGRLPPRGHAASSSTATCPRL